jgi:HTH-type transcriptional regulator/antitoxin HigA
MSTALANNPAKMIEKGAPRIIRNEAELEAYTEALFKLSALEHPSPSEIDAAELLTLLIERYEDEHYPIADSDPVSVVKYLIKKGGLTQRSLVPEFGTESAVSMFLSGQRSLTLEQVKKLCARFKLDASVFLPLAVGAKASK